MQLLIPVMLNCISPGKPILFYRNSADPAQKRETSKMRIQEFNNNREISILLPSFTWTQHRMAANPPLRLKINISLPFLSSNSPINRISIPRLFHDASIPTYKVFPTKSIKIRSCLPLFKNINRQQLARGGVLLEASPLVTLPENVYQKMVQEKANITHRFDKLKTDVDVFQKNAVLQKTKELALLQHNFAKKLIPLGEEFARASDFTPSMISSKNWRKFIENLKINLQMIHESFIRATGLVQIAPHVGDLFEINSERVSSIVYDDAKPPNSIMSIIRLGYSFGGEVLQPAEVVLSTNNPQHPNLAQSPNIQTLSVARSHRWLDQVRSLFQSKKVP